MNKHIIATHKIILFVVFISAALITSLFVFKMSHAQAPSITSDEYSTIFPVARDLKDFNLVKTDNAAFTQKDLRQHWSLLFFGFTHCPNVCPTTMGMLSKAYPELHKTHSNLQVVLVSLDPERDSKVILEKYTKNFHPDFISTSGKIEEIRKLQSQLGIFSMKEGNELQHTSSIILINPQGKWAAIFKYGMTPTQFIQSFENNVNKLSG